MTTISIQAKEFLFRRGRLMASIPCVDTVGIESALTTELVTAKIVRARTGRYLPLTSVGVKTIRRIRDARFDFKAVGEVESG